MMEALKRRFVPALKARGFKGSFPYFHRPLSDRVDYLMVQFYSSGGSFVLEAGRSGPDGVDDEPWRDVPISKLNPTYLRHRKRLTPRNKAFNNGGFWDFGPRSYDSATPVKPAAHYDAIADDALMAVEQEAEPWFSSDDPGEAPRVGDPPFFRDGPFTRFMPWNRPRLRIACLTGPSEPLLHRHEVWQQIVPAMDELVALLPQPVWISSAQVRPGRVKELPFGKLKWSAEANRTWTTKYLEAPEPVEFLATNFWSPSRERSVGQRKDPDFFASIDYADFAAEQGFVLALRLELLDKCGTAADAVLAAVAAAVPGMKRVVFDRGWEEKKVLGFIPINNLDDVMSGAVMDWAQTHPSSQVASFAPDK